MLEYEFENVIPVERQVTFAASALRQLLIMGNKTNSAADRSRRIDSSDAR
jgi:hypothetical protein